jgi:hypothetical protein
VKVKHPTQQQWKRATEGWTIDGTDRRCEKLDPDGSSASLDDIMGIRIGISSNTYEDSFYPANKHDFIYWYARNHEGEWCKRIEGDADYRDGCRERVSRLIGAAGWLARRICRGRYIGLRIAGRKAYGHKWLGFGPRGVS